MRLHTHAAIAAVASLTFQSAAAAQVSVDDAHATVNRLLNGAGSVLVTTSGRIIDSGHKTVTGPRTTGRCATTFGETFPNSSDIPESYRGKVGDEVVHRWNEVTTLSASGSRVYYDQIRKASGQPFTYHFQFGSSSAANAFLAAARVLADACNGKAEGKGPPQAAERVTHDPKAGSASLAIDRANGSRYGWAVDWPSWTEADRRALQECQRLGGNCQVVLRFKGGCGAYAADQAKGSSVYGWGTAIRRQEAENRAWDEARQRGATNLVTRVWGCNSVKERHPESAGIGSPRGTTVSGTDESSPATALPGKGKLSDEVIRRNAEAERAHQAQVDAYNRKLADNAAALARAVEQRKAIDAVHQAELAKAQAERARYERDRQAYREEYKRVTGRYPDE
jgi:hypothetical protein